jgi:hypothetical protein
MKVYAGVDVQIGHSFTSALDGSECSASRICKNTEDNIKIDLKETGNYGGKLFSSGI